mmetsp:Transcript_12898/g.30986  ORF Transcript_12898/g.30986 Transcript_12898/m.30986 type:complete len:247 (-) Transcript_12898:221-961(-)
MRFCISCARNLHCSDINSFSVCPSRGTSGTSFCRRNAKAPSGASSSKVHTISAGWPGRPLSGQHKSLLIATQPQIDASFLIAHLKVPYRNGFKTFVSSLFTCPSGYENNISLSCKASSILSSMALRLSSSRLKSFCFDPAKWTGMWRSDFIICPINGVLSRYELAKTVCMASNLDEPATHSTTESNQDVWFPINKMPRVRPSDILSMRCLFSIRMLTHGQHRKAHGQVKPLMTLHTFATFFWTGVG